MQRLAVFARNHESYLEAACNVTDLTQLVTFQSKKRWAGAWEALNTHHSLKIYFAPIGAGAMIKYEATLQKIDLHPDKKADLLQFRLSDTISEGLWGKTLYAVSQCRRCENRNLSTLQKIDGTPLSDNFGYSYALVRECELAPQVENHPEEISAEMNNYPEGAVGKVFVNAYERNAAARLACVKHHGTSCVVCGFNFGATYGKIGEGFIHVHHLKPLASIKSNYSVHPIRDLRPVCPNCHAMLHTQTPPRSIDEVRELVRMTTSKSA
jgi:hypothetical protein